MIPAAILILCISNQRHRIIYGLKYPAPKENIRKRSGVDHCWEDFVFLLTKSGATCRSRKKDFGAETERNLPTTPKSHFAQ